jgi:membrane fusion protein (multidrug efflux system)
MVELARARSIDLVDEIHASGELLAVDEATVAAEVAGRITEILRDEGEAVVVGDVLIRVDPERHALELANARARHVGVLASLREAERELRRIRSLHEQGVASLAALDSAETAHGGSEALVRAAEARVGVAERAWRDSEVRAPFDGLIARRHVSRGEFVSMGTPLVELVAVDPIEVEFHLPERDSARVHPGLPVEVRVAPLPEEVFRARVHMVAPNIDSRTHTLRVKARIENARGRLKPGLFARVDLGTEQREDVIVVPEQAVLQRADGSVVFTMNGSDRVRRVTVETGVHQAGWVEVRRGIETGELVVTQGQARLTDGLVVRSRERVESPVVVGDESLR